MSDVPTRALKVACLALWLVVILLPLLALAIGAVSSQPQPELIRPIFASLLRTIVLAGIIATVSVALGWLPGRLLGTCGTHSDALLLLLLLPLVLPQYVLYYAWSLLLSPTTQLGRMLASSPALARFVGTAVSTGVLIGWYWPLAALILAQGRRSIDRRTWQNALLDASSLQAFRHVTMPLLSRTILLAFGVCFVLSLSEFATFHLAGVKTVGTELAVLYELTGAAAPVARAAWPIAIVALLISIFLARASNEWTAASPVSGVTRIRPQVSDATVFAVLMLVSWAAPILLLVANVTTLQPLRQFIALHLDDLLWSLLTAGAAAVLACLIGLSGLLWTTDRAPSAKRSVGRYLVHASIFLAMFLPASLLAISLLRLCVGAGLPADMRQSWLMVAAGQASRFAGVALILLLLTRYPDRRRLSAMASLDGASPLAAWRFVHLPRTWPVLVGTFLLVTMLSITELPATMVLLPAGLPNFAQRLLNQMHYARDQQVIASCLILVSLFAVLAGAVFALLRLGRIRSYAGVLLLTAVLVLSGCGDRRDGEPKVVGAFGETGSGPGEFLYPRGIDLDGDGSLFVVDKTGRIQHLTQEGQCLGVIQMPLTEAGKPTGISLHKDGRLFVADTHYHRVVIFSREGQLIGEFGKYGQDGGCFIYPTDVAFAPDGRIFVSEYGGNDRISIFTANGDFLASFGSPGAEEGQFSRPAALCVDAARGCLYVADACNHRIAVYDLEGKLTGYFGSAGRGPGQLRYPYGLSLLSDGTIVVCEFGNNRIQLFNPQGESLAVYGQSGRELGQLAYPWSVVVDSHRRAYVVDAGNNRIQVWQL
jgi:ABC-type Fe3+ transport system permease subunit/DNA-binding beta-propeller fold protein YncE